MIHPGFFFIIAFLFDATICCSGIVVNLYAQDLGASAFQLGLLGFVWGSAYCAVTLMSGRMIDRIPRRLLTIVGVAAFATYVFLNCFAHTPITLIWLNLLAGSSCGLFWPTFETLLHVHDDEKQTARNMRVFNIGWTLGIATGVGSGGFLMAWGALYAFQLIVAVALMTVGLLIFATRRGIPAAMHAQDLKAQMNGSAGTMSPRARAFLQMAWIGNFCMWFTGAAVGALFPKLARSLAIPNAHIGILIAIITASQSLTFYGLSRTQSWHYRMKSLMVLQLISVVGLGIVVCGRLPVVFGLAMALVGIGRGMTYSSSLFYGLTATRGGGTSTGVHESIIGFGFIFGPLLSGLAAQHISLRAPFVLSIIVFLVGMVWQVALWKKLSDNEVEISAQLSESLTILGGKAT